MLNQGSFLSGPCKKITISWQCSWRWTFFDNTKFWLKIQECCARGRYQGKAHVITSHRYCGMQLLVPALDTCFWHKNPQIILDIELVMRSTVYLIIILSREYVLWSLFGLILFLQNILSGHWDGAGSRNPSSVKTKTYISYIINPMAADNLMNLTT